MIDDVSCGLVGFEQKGTGASQLLCKGCGSCVLAGAQMVNSLKRFAILLVVVMLSGCASLVGSVTSGIADRLSSAILNSPDIETVKEAIPAYLVLIDGFLVDGEGDPSLYLAASQLNGAFTRWSKRRELRFSRQKLSITPSAGLASSGGNCAGLASYLLNHSRPELTGCPLKRSTPLINWRLPGPVTSKQIAAICEPLDNWAE